jgi:serine/threonine protein kinase
MIGTTATPDGGDAGEIPGYDMLDVLGHGGLTVVYRARQRSLDRLVAARTALGEAAPETITQCLVREAGILARLRHPHVVSILDRFQHGGRLYLILELAEGGNLAARIAGHPQPARPAATLIERLARTLYYVHQAGIVHCN